jgi:tRNA dimethylallyltransferase
VTAGPPLLVLAGPTATGKTGLSVAIAEALARDGVPAEIVLADSRQVYRGLDIGTAKITAEARRAIPHHGLDLVDPDEPFTLADFAAHARDVLAGIAKGGGVAILVGGTGLYLRAIARGIDTAALPSDAQVRARLQAALDDEGLEPLVARLRDIAPTRAAAIDLRNPRRVVRALEIAELIGDTAAPPFRGYDGAVRWIGLDVERSVHREWIERRAREQFAAGLIDEAKALRERYREDLPAFSAIGYREAWSVLDGRASVDEAIAADVRRNVAFAKRQRTWFRAEPDVEWLDGAADAVPHAVAAARSLIRG